MNNNIKKEDTPVTGHIWNDMRNFHSKYGFDGHITKQQLWGRIEFIEEELNELKEAFENKSEEGVLDALIDILVVATGTLDLVSAHGLFAWITVMEANNRKEIGFNEKRPNSKGQDLIKPLGWEGPELGGLTGDLLTILLEDYIPVVKQTKEREGHRVLEECIELFKKKSADYNSPDSSVKAADYYPRGIDDLVHTIDITKRLRQTSLLESTKHNGNTPNFETLEDTIKDRIIYLAIAVEYLRGKMEGQTPGRNIFNEEVESADRK